MLPVKLDQNVHVEQVCNRGSLRSLAAGGQAERAESREQADHAAEVLLQEVLQAEEHVLLVRATAALEVAVDFLRARRVLLEVGDLRKEFISKSSISTVFVAL